MGILFGGDYVKALSPTKIIGCAIADSQYSNAYPTIFLGHSFYAIVAKI